MPLPAGVEGKVTEMAVFTNVGAFKTTGTAVQVKILW